ncbi:polysaccharide lyase beta-sandwich domain-containing protein [Streptomyces griseoincarnatus]
MRVFCRVGRRDPVPARGRWRVRPRPRPRASAGGFRTAADEAVRSPRPQGRALGEAAAGRGGRRLVRRQRGRPARSRTRRRQTRWLDHGTGPADARYACVLLPGAARDEVARRAVGPRRPRGLADDASRQAVEALSLSLTAAFWWPGSAGGLTVSRPAAVPLRRQGRTGTLSVSHPTRTGEPQVLEWGRPVRKVPDHPDAVEILPTGPRPRLRVTRGEACATPRVRRLSAAELCATPTSSRPSEQSKRLHSRLVLFSATRKTPRRL